MKKPKRRTGHRGKPSTALARVPSTGRQTLELRIHDPHQMLPLPAPPADLNVLTDNPMLGALGLVEVKLTPKEEETLNEPVLRAEIQIKPTGQPYLSHPAYTRWFNRAFGRLGWAIVARTNPLRQGPSVVCGYILYIHGSPAAFAYGEQEYFESNKEQTYGDALEATVASALRRCAKRLGVGLEMWDRQFLEEFKATECVEVWREGVDKPQWRRRRDPPFWNERGEVQAKGRKGHVQQQGTGSRPPADAGYDGSEELPITNVPRTKTNQKVGQVQRLMTILKNSGRTRDEVKAWLAVAYGYASSTEIKRKHYEAICAAIEQKGPLPKGPLQLETREREPGEEG